ncbi:gamma-glutamyltransferase [Mesorhizobium sp. M1339]|uniref:gamma-glutamyltransferase n=1 Tax=Mesorhizobium sp. M1339 TaxID=2957086 RepID=UPI00333E16C1
MPGALLAWCEALVRFGKLPLVEVIQPAIDLAERGFAVTPYLTQCTQKCANDLDLDPALRALLLGAGQSRACFRNP